MLLPLLAVTGQSARSSSSFDRLLAQELVEEARTLIEEDDTEAARLLLERAHGIDPESGEPIYLLASIVPHDRDTLQRREWLLRRARASDHSDQTGEQIVIDLARLLIDTDRSEEAATLLDGHTGVIARAMDLLRAGDTGIPQPAGEENISTLDRLFLEARLRAYPGWFTSNLLRYLRARYPRDVDLARLDWQRHRRIGPGLLEWIEATEADTTVLLDTILLVPGTERNVFFELVERYFRRSGRDPVPAAIALVRQAEDDRFMVSDPGTLEALVQTALDDGDKHIWEALAAGSENGEMWHDRLPALFQSAGESIQSAPKMTLHRRAAHGLGRTRYSLKNGRLHRWIQDQNGDGLAEQVMDVDGNRLYLFERSDKAVVVLQFSRYPLVTRVYKLAVADDPEILDQWNPDPPGERILLEDSRLWIPPQPIAFDPALRVEHPHRGRVDYNVSLGTEGFLMWDILAGRVTFDRRAQGRFDRQLTSETARVLSELEIQELTERMRSLELLR